MRKKKVIVYISGKYSGEVQENIEAARQMAVTLIEQGYTPLTPHLNTANFDTLTDKLKYEDYIEHDLILLERVDCVLMLPGWIKSRGAQIEHQYAMKNNIPIFLSLEKLNQFYGGDNGKKQS